MLKLGSTKFSWKLACGTFAGIVIFDFLSAFLTALFNNPDKMTWPEWLLAVPFWTVNILGLPLINFLRHGKNHATILITLLAILLLGAVFWSVIFGYYFGDKLPPEKSPTPTALGAGGSTVVDQFAGRR